MRISKKLIPLTECKVGKYYIVHPAEGDAHRRRFLEGGECAGKYPLKFIGLRGTADFVEADKRGWDFAFLRAGFCQLVIGYPPKAAKSAE